jgi:hypothetical protein
MPATHPHHEKHVTIAVLISILAATAAFHFLFWEYGVGLSLALFIIILVTIVHVLKIIAGGAGNAWAYLFLVPVLLSLAAGVLYASEPTNAFAFIITFISTPLFIYWFTAPKRSLRDVKTLWPSTFFIETAFPFRYIGEYIGRIGKGKRTMTKLAFGAIISVPFIVIFSALFFTADPLFKKAFDDMFYSESWSSVLERGIVDLIAVLFFTGAAWAFVSRLRDGRSAEEPHDHEHIDTTILNTVLALLTLLFAAFIGFQFVYFFGGESFILSQGIPYAVYAREGFFQLLAVSVLVVGIVIALYRYSNMKHWLLKGLTILFILETGVILVSAVRRLMLYVEAYGLTLSRYWAFAAIDLIALGLLLLLISIVARFEIRHVEKYGFIGFSILLSAILLINVEGVIARYNISQYMAGRLGSFDTDYLYRDMTVDAIPSSVAAYKLYQGLLGDEVKTNALKAHLASYETSFAGKSQFYARRDWRAWRFTDNRALAELHAAGFSTVIVPQSN